MVPFVGQDFFFVRARFSFFLASPQSISALHRKYTEQDPFQVALIADSLHSEYISS